jgi:DNA repair exonuclease SbcCD ATPase subunit
VSLPESHKKIFKENKMTTEQEQAEITRLRDALKLRDKSINQLQQTIVNMRQRERELSEQLNHYKNLAEQTELNRQKLDLNRLQADLEQNYKALQALQNTLTVRISRRIGSVIRRKP